METGLDPRLADTDLGPSNEAQVNALKMILGIGGGALAVGAGARGLSGIGSFLSRNLGGGPRTPQRQSFVRIPVPVKVKTREERDAMLAAAEGGEDAGLAKMANDMWTTAADWLGLLRHPNEHAGWLRKTFGGWGKQNPGQMPWTWPAAGAAIGGGLYGGWKLTDYLLDKTKNVEQESELEEARKDYEKALASRSKMASAEPEPLDALADLCEKRGLWDEFKGMGLLLGLGTAGISGLGAYNWARSLAQDKAVEEAVKRRQAQIAEQAPSPVMAIPTPTPIYEPRRSHWHRLMGHEPEKKEEKKANIGQAADQFLGRIRNNQMAVWQRLMTPTDGKPAKPEKPAEPAPPQLPTLAGTRTRLMGQQPA